MDSAPWTVTGGWEPARGRWNREARTGFRAEGVTAGMGWGQEGSTEWGRHTDASQGVKMVAPGSSLSPPIPGRRSRWELLSVCCAPVVPPVMGTKSAIGPAPCPAQGLWVSVTLASLVHLDMQKFSCLCPLPHQVWKGSSKAGVPLPSSHPEPSPLLGYSFALVWAD